ncbi:class I SAM-dependent methyltransferase [bacterium]|nr:class I SAM-dependent methyltransferase [bacterium]
MGREIDLMRNYPRTKRDPLARGASKSAEDQALARKFGKEFFDGERSHGYGGFHYNSRFWEPVVPDFIEHYSLTNADRLLDVGCAKGFMLHDFKCALPHLKVAGIDVSDYAIENCIQSVKGFCEVGNALELPFEDNEFDVSISITTLHNLDGDDLVTALKEIQRVSRRGSFITVDAYTNDQEKEAMYAWNLTAKTILHVDDWKNLFARAGYTGDYYWFMP